MISYAFDFLTVMAKLENPAFDARDPKKDKKVVDT